MFVWRGERRGHNATTLYEAHYLLPYEKREVVWGHPAPPSCAHRSGWIQLWIRTKRSARMRVLLPPLPNNKMREREWTNQGTNYKVGAISSSHCYNNRSVKTELFKLCNLRPKTDHNVHSSDFVTTFLCVSALSNSLERDVLIFDIRRLVKDWMVKKDRRIQQNDNRRDKEEELKTSEMTST